LGIQWIYVWTLKFGNVIIEVSRDFDLTISFRSYVVANYYAIYTYGVENDYLMVEKQKRKQYVFFQTQGSTIN